MNKELIISQKQIENRIFTIRGIQVMLDRDLAEMYKVETRILNQAVKRNIERFPKEYRFQLTEKETEELLAVCDRVGRLGWQNTVSISRSQFVILNNKRGRNIKYQPYVFTEQGVAMLSAVLRSEIAIKVSIQIINAFVQLRKIVQNNQLIFSRLDQVERKQLETDQKFERVFNALGNKKTIPNQGVFFDGQVFDAYELASRIIRSAKQSIILIDNYIDETTLIHLAKKKNSVKVLLLTRNMSKRLNLDIQKVNEQYGSFEIKQFTQSHDRFLVIDDKEVYHLGFSLKDLGKKWFAFSKMDKSSVGNIINAVSKLI